MFCEQDCSDRTRGNGSATVSGLSHQAFPASPLFPFSVFHPDRHDQSAYQNISGSPGCAPILGTSCFLHSLASIGFWSFLLWRGQSTADFLHLIPLPTAA
uniref:Uncharacterized protein n=1 Tax=Strigops habroptila TaxID=2489341 RepID=A0A672UDX2_STRHB